MPIREFECVSCSRSIEVLQRMSDSALLSLEGCADTDKCRIRQVMGACVLKFSKSIDIDAPNIMWGGPKMEPVVTRDWLNPDGTLTPQKKSDWLPGPGIG